MSAVTERERFLATLLGERTDRFPRFDLEPADDTLARWRREGLPEDATAAGFFDLEVHHPAGLDLRTSPRYVGPPERLDDADVFARHYDPDTPSRCEEGFAERCARLRREGRVVCVDAWAGGFLQAIGVGDWRSFDAAMIALVERPGMIERLMDRITDFYCQCLEKVLPEVRADYATLYEPIAANKGPVISPRMFRRYVLPGYRKVLDLLRASGVPLRILCTTGGNLGELIPALVESGVNGLWISNLCSAGTDYATIRRSFGPGLSLIGGIDSTALTESDGAVRRAVEETVPDLLDAGHYLPCLDDRPRSLVPFSRYALYRRLLDEMTARA